MKKYKYIIFDVDDTLLDFESAFRLAQENVAKKLGITCSGEFLEVNDKCGWKAWKECRLEDTEAKDVQENYHTYYYEYLRKYYLYLGQELQMDIDADELVECYIKSIASSKTLTEENALQVYQTLSEQYKVLIATNGMEYVQKERLVDFQPYTYRTYISEAVQYIKPSEKFFRYILNDLACEPSECLMIGDSLTNDIVGAKSVGMDVCFYNIRKKDIPEYVSVDYEINELKSLLCLLEV